MKVNNGGGKSLDMVMTLLRVRDTPTDPFSILHFLEPTTTFPPSFLTNGI